jgi:hypothetical protein
MGTAPRKRLKLKHKQLKQLKRTYKIPRSLKKSIKKNLVKIVKRHKQEVSTSLISRIFILPTSSEIFP